jgi:hypothetical protein
VTRLDGAQRLPKSLTRQGAVWRRTRPAQSPRSASSAPYEGRATRCTMPGVFRERGLTCSGVSLG